VFGPSLSTGTDPRALPSGGSLPSLPDGSGVALGRLASLNGTPSLANLADPSALAGTLESQVAQNQQLLQLMTLLLSLMLNKTGQAESGNSSEDSSASSGSGGSAPVGSAGNQEKGDLGKADSGNGSTVQRQGKPIGAQIAKQFDDMVAAAKKDGVNITITSGFRSRAEQEKLYAAYQNGTGNLAAKPGTSNHESGDALDLGPPSAYAWLKQNAGQFGFKNKIASEPWHWSLTGN